MTRSAALARSLAKTSIIDILVFFAVLLVGFAYVWMRGDLDWVRAVSNDERLRLGRPWQPSTPTKKRPRWSADRTSPCTPSH